MNLEGSVALVTGANRGTDMTALVDAPALATPVASR
jgi:hypothetical protein